MTLLNFNHFKRQAGLSLIELMIGITISLIVMTGVSMILVSANKTSRMQDGLLQLQEDARFALEKITRDIQLGGYYGCATTNDKITNQVSAASYTFQATPILGENNPDATIPGDIITIVNATHLSTLDADMTSKIDNLVVPSTDLSKFTAGDVVVISNCEAGDVVAITGIDANNNAIIHSTTSTGTNAPVNNDNALSTVYTKNNYSGKSTDILKLHTNRYALVQDATDTTLFSLTLNGTELVRGVDGFEVLYGIDTDSDLAPDQYVDATSVASWSSVIAVRFALLLRTEQTYGQGGDRKTGPIKVLDATYPDNNINARRRLFQTTAYIRNSSSL